MNVKQNRTIMKKMIVLLQFFMFSVLVLNAGSGYEIGDKAMDFKLKNIDNSYVTLSDYAGEKGVVVVFTCNHCPYAQAYEKRLMDLHNKYADRGMPFIFVNPNDEKVVPGDSFEAMKKRAAQKGYNFPYVKDEKQEVYKVYGATNTPHVYVLNRKGGDFLVSYIGTIDDNYGDASKVSKTYLADALDAILKGRKPEPAYTKAIGCSIKTRK